MEFEFYNSLVRPKESASIRLILVKDQYEQGEQTGTVIKDEAVIAMSPGEFIEFNFSLQPGAGMSTGNFKITEQSLFNTLNVSDEDKKKIKALSNNPLLIGYSYSQYYASVSGNVLSDPYFMTKYLKDFGIIIKDGKGNEIIFKHLTATRVDFENLSVETNAQIINISFADQRWLLEERGVFLRANCVVGNKFEQNWFAPDTKKPDGKPYTAADIFAFLIEEIYASNYKGNVILSKNQMPQKDKKKILERDYYPYESVVDVTDQKLFGNLPTDIEWTGQPLSECLSSMCEEIGVTMGMTPSGDIYFYKIDNYYGLPNFNIGLLKGTEYMSSGIASLSGGFEGPRVPEKIVIVGSRRRDQIQVFPSAGWSLPKAWYGREAGSKLENDLIDDLLEDINERLSWYREGFIDPGLAKDYNRDFLLKEALERIKADGARSDVSAGMMPISEDWPDGKIKDLNIVGKNWQVELKDILLGYLPARRSGVLDSLLRDVDSEVRHQIRVDMETAWEDLQNKLENFDDLWEAAYDSSKTTSELQAEFQDEIAEIKEAQRTYNEARRAQTNAVSRQFEKGTIFEIYAKRSIIESQWFRWYRLPDFVEVKYDSASMKARKEYINAHRMHNRWADNAGEFNIGRRDDTKSVEYDFSGLSSGNNITDLATRACDESRASGEAYQADDNESNTLEKVTVPRFFVTPWCAELNNPYWSFPKDDDTSGIQSDIQDLRAGDESDYQKFKLFDNYSIDSDSSFPEPVRSEPIVWSYTINRALDGAYFDQPLTPVLAKNRKIDTERGYVMFSEEAPGPRNPSAKISELAYYLWPLVGIEFCYERKDPTLGIHNFYHYELTADTAPGYIKKLIDGTPKEKRHVKYIKMSELVEMLYDGKSLNKKELDNMIKSISEAIWNAEIRGAHGVAQLSLAFLRECSPNNKISTVSWNVSASGVTTSISLGSGASGRTVEQILKTMIQKLKKAEIDKAPYKYSFRASPSIGVSASKGGIDWRANMPHETSGSHTDEALRLINDKHVGLQPIYDPEEAEDILYCQASKINPLLHLHSISRVGPYLCKEASPVKGSLPIRGYSWWADGEHAAGGHWYPYVLMPIDYSDGPTVVPVNPTAVGGAPVGSGVPLPDPVSGPYSGPSRWNPVPAPAAPVPFHTFCDCDECRFPKIPHDESQKVTPTGLNFPSERSASAMFTGQWQGLMTDDGTERLKTSDGLTPSAGAFIVFTYNNEDGLDDKCARFRLYVAAAYIGDKLDLDTLYTLSPDRIYVKDFNLPIKAGETGVSHIIGTIDLPPSVTEHHAQFIAILARLTEHENDTFDGSVVMTDFKWTRVSDTSAFTQPDAAPVTYDEVVDDTAPTSVFDIIFVDSDTDTIYVNGDASNAEVLGYIIVNYNPSINGNYVVDTATYDSSTGVTTIVIDPTGGDLPDCDSSNGTVIISAAPYGEIESFTPATKTVVLYGDATADLAVSSEIDITSSPANCHGDGVGAKAYTVDSISFDPVTGLTTVVVDETMDIMCADTDGTWTIGV